MCKYHFLLISRHFGEKPPSDISDVLPCTVFIYILFFSSIVDCPLPEDRNCAFSLCNPHPLGCTAGASLTPGAAGVGQEWRSLQKTGPEGRVRLAGLQLYRSKGLEPEAWLLL